MKMLYYSHICAADVFSTAQQQDGSHVFMTVHTWTETNSRPLRERKNTKLRAQRGKSLQEGSVALSPCDC